MSFKREGELLIPFLSVLNDILIIEFSLIFSYWLRFYSPLVKWVPVSKGFPPFSAYLYGSFFLVAAWLLIFNRFGLYRSRRNISPIDEAGRLVKAVSMGLLVMMSATFFYRGFSFSRLVFLLVWLTSLFFLTFTRVLLLYLEKWRHRRNRGLLNVAIIGRGGPIHRVLENILQTPGFGYRMLGYVGETGAYPQIPRLGGTAELPQLIRQHQIHVLVLALTEEQHQLVWSIMKSCEGLNVEFLLLPDLLEMLTSQLQVVQFCGVSALKLKEVRIKGWQGILKRVFDISISLFALILLAPVLITVAILIKLDSRGSVIYKQERVGFDGREFWIFKFRTMKTGAEQQTGPIWAQTHDPRRTRIGAFLRRTSIDELPQLFNVLRGEMSLVGPRPERKFFVDKFKEEIPRYLERHRVKSGMTGWAQVNGLRGNTPIDERTKYDIYYIENWSMAFDLKIILKTLSTVISGENSY
jgi:exopolysaccharide biosynthesis polyprenyl glycosylphosphotransferase